MIHDLRLSHAVPPNVLKALTALLTHAPFHACARLRLKMLLEFHMYTRKHAQHGQPSNMT